MSDDAGSPIIGRRVVHVHTTQSTMEDVANLAEAGEEEGIVVQADLQTAGRGRGGRIWMAPRGSSILASVLLRPAVRATRLTVLPLIFGVAVAKTIEQTAGCPCQLKWPNDVWIDQRKVSGILMTAKSTGMRTPVVLLGIGVNVNIPAGELVPGATSLLAATGRRYDLDEVFRSLLTELDAAYRSYLAARGSPSLDEWRQRAALRDELVLIRNNGEDMSGWMRGVDERGHLLLEVAPGDVRELVAGELTRGPIRL